MGANETIVSALKSTMSGKLFHTLTIRSLKNLARTVEEECLYIRYYIKNSNKRYGLLKVNSISDLE